MTGVLVFLRGAGVMCLALWVVGVSGRLHVGAAVNWVDLALGVGLIGLGSVAKR